MNTKYPTIQTKRKLMNNSKPGIQTASTFQTAVCVKLSTTNRIPHPISHSKWSSGSHEVNRDTDQALDGRTDWNQFESKRFLIVFDCHWPCLILKIVATLQDPALAQPGCSLSLCWAPIACPCSLFIQISASCLLACFPVLALELQIIPWWTDLAEPTKLWPCPSRLLSIIYKCNPVLVLFVRSNILRWIVIVFVFSFLCWSVLVSVGQSFDQWVIGSVSVGHKWVSRSLCH